MGAESHLYHMTCWESSSGRWHVNDVKNLTGRASKWYTPMRILNISVEEYINLLLTFNAKGIYYYLPTDYLAFYFSKEKDAKTFCSYINKKAQHNNYYCV